MDEKQKDGQPATEKPEDFESSDNFEMEETGLLEASRPDIVKQCKPEEEATFVDDKGKSKQADLCFSPPGKTFPSSDEIQRRVQQQIDDINAKRKRDTDLLNDFRKAFEMQVSKTCGAIEESIVKSYEDQSHVIEEKLQEIFAAIERIRQLETELGNFKEILGMLYTDMQSV